MESEIQGWNQKDFDPEIQGWKASVPEFRVWISRGSRISGMDKSRVHNGQDVAHVDVLGLERKVNLKQKKKN